MRHLGQFQRESSAALEAEMGRREAAREAERSEDWRAQLWMQRRWKTAKQREEQDQVGSERRMRSRHMRQERAPERDEVKKDWILERSGEEWPVSSM